MEKCQQRLYLTLILRLVNMRTWGHKLLVESKPLFLNRQTTKSQKLNLFEAQDFGWLTERWIFVSSSCAKNIIGHNIRSLPVYIVDQNLNHSCEATNSYCILLSTCLLKYIGMYVTLVASINICLHWILFAFTTIHKIYIFLAVLPLRETNQASCHAR